MWIDYTANQVLYFLRRLPIVGKRIPSGWGQKKRTKIICFALIAAGRLLLEIVKKFAFGAVFFVLPRYLFCRRMAVGEAGFGIDDSFVYFTLVLNCIAGSLLHSFVFSVNERSVSFLKGMRVVPKRYFRCGLLQRLGLEAIAFWLMVTVFGMNPFKAFYLTLLVAASRFVGETFHILVFRITKRRLSDLKGAGSMIMAVALFAAYFVPYIRGCVPAIYNMIFTTIWFGVIIVVASFFIYFVWNCEDYTMIANRIHTVRYLDLEKREDGAQAYEAVKEDDGFVPDGFVLKTHGLQYLERLLILRNRKTIRQDLLFRVGFILLALGVALIAVGMGHGEIVCSVTELSFPVLAVVMYLLSNGFYLSRIRFSQSDRYLLRYGYYRFRENLIRQFAIRLKDTVLLNLFPAAILALAYVLAFLAAGASENYPVLLQTCAEILLLSVFFSVFHMLIYYLFQPYNTECRQKNPLSGILQFLMLLGCYGCIYIDTAPLLFVLGTAAATALLLAVSGTLVWYFGGIRFRIYKTSFKVCKK